MKKAAAMIIAGTLFASGSAWAKDYGDSGTIELGGNVSFGSTTTKMKEDESAIPGDQDSQDDATTSITLEPEVSFYLLPGLALLGSIGIGMDTTEDKLPGGTKSSSQSLDVGVGAGFFLPIGKARIGPAAKVSYISETDTDGEGATKTEDKLTGQGVTVAGVAKLPIGSGGVITAALVVEYEMLKEDFEGAKADITRTTIGTSVGVSVWF